MDINENLHPRSAPDSAPRSAPHGAPDGAPDGVLPTSGDDLRDVPAPTLQLVRAIGARLRAPLAARRRDELAVELAAVAVAAASTPDADATTGGRAASRDATPSRPVSSRDGSSRPSSSRPATRARSLRRLSAAAAALVVLAGGVSVLTRSGDDLPMLDLAAGPGVGPAATMDAAGTREGGMIEPALGDRMMWWVPTTYRFELAAGVALPAGQAPAWRLVRPADLAAAAAPIAATLGLPTLAASEWDVNTLWSESEADGSLWVSPSGDWYYGGPAHLWPVWDCPTVDAGDSRTEPAPADGTAGSVGSVGECTPPAPPVGVPDAARAGTLAVEFLATVGHRDVRVIDVWADEWGAWVTAEPTMGGVPAGSGLTVSVGFGAQGRVTSANGTLATVERIGEYPTIDAAAAVARLQDDLNAWQLGGPVARPMPADAGTSEGRGSDTVDPDAPVSDPDAPVSDQDAPASDPDGDADTPVTILPIPDGDAPVPGPDGDVEPVELTVTIVSVELVTALAWTASGEMLLLPHYRLVDSDGGWWFVVAVADRYLAR
jgi:hypothetical protein